MTCVIVTYPCVLPGFLPQCFVSAVGGQVGEHGMPPEFKA